MAYWTMGVGVPIKNNSFRFGTKKETTFSAGEAALQTILSVTETSPTLSKLLRANDRVLLGPNSAGQSETALVSSTGSGTITIPSPGVTYAYSSGDPVTFIGTRLAEAWDISGTHTPASIDGGGKDDDYAQQLSFGGVDGARKFYQTLSTVAGLSQFEATTVYRFGCNLDVAGSSAVVGVAVNDGSSDFITGTASAAGYSSLASYTDTGTSAAIGSLGAGEIYFDYDSGTVDTVNIDCVYLEHASGTDDAASGVYTFDEYPALGSVGIETRETEIEAQLLNNTLAVFDPFNSQGKEVKHTVTAEFGYCAQTFMDNLTVLLRWQRKGNLLTLHTALDNIPPVLYGKMYITNRRKDMYDVTRSSFAFTFKEV